MQTTRRGAVLAENIKPGRGATNALRTDMQVKRKAGRQRGGGC